MAVRYVPYGSVRVSRRWRVVLRVADKAGVRFHVTSGHRTMREQWALFRQNMVWSVWHWVPRPGHPLTAYPSPRAPHIRTGRPNHALDVNSLNGGEQRLENWLDSHKGIDAENTVPGEAWHLELSARELRRLYRKYRKLRPRRKLRLRRKQRLGRRGRAFLIRQEGVRRYAYNDSEGHATFGVGHLLHRGPVTDWDRLHWGTPDHPKPLRLVHQVLRDDLETFEETIRDAAGRLRAHEFAACVSLAFNIGVGGFASSTVARELARGRGHGHYRAAAEAFLLWDKPAVLLARRQREKRLFLTGRYR